MCLYVFTLVSVSALFSTVAERNPQVWGNGWVEFQGTNAA